MLSNTTDVTKYIPKVTRGNRIEYETIVKYFSKKQEFMPIVDALKNLVNRKITMSPEKMTKVEPKIEVKHLSDKFKSQIEKSKPESIPEAKIESKVPEKPKTITLEENYTHTLKSQIGNINTLTGVNKTNKSYQMSNKKQQLSSSQLKSMDLVEANSKLKPTSVKVAQ